MHILGEKQVESVGAELGVEQEFFLIDRDFFNGLPPMHQLY
jgi:glutamine synthetase type III